MNQILRCDWLPSEQDGTILPLRDYPPCAARKRSRKAKMAGFWPSFFCELMDLDSVSFHELTKKEFDQYPAILISHLANNSYLKYLNIS